MINFEKAFYAVGSFFGRGNTKVKSTEQLEKILLGDIQNPFGKYKISTDVFKSFAEKNGNEVTIPHGVNVRLTGKANLGDITVAMKGSSGFYQKKGISGRFIIADNASPEQISGKLSLLTPNYGEPKPVKFTK